MALIDVGRVRQSNLTNPRVPLIFPFRSPKRMQWAHFVAMHVLRTY